MVARVRVVIAHFSGDATGGSAEGLARSLRDAGLEVIYVGAGLNAAQLSATVIQEDADALIVDGGSDAVGAALDDLDGVEVFSAAASVESVLEWARNARDATGRADLP